MNLNSADMTPGEEIDPLAITPKKPNSDTRPTVTHAEYLELIDLSRQKESLKSKAWDLMEFVEKGDVELTAARDKLKTTRIELSAVTLELNVKFQEAISPHQLPEGQKVSISDEEPHYIIPAE